MLPVPGYLFCLGVGYKGSPTLQRTVPVVDIEGKDMVHIVDYLDSELIVEVLDLIVCLGEVLHRIRHQLLLLLLAGVRLLGQLKTIIYTS